MSDIADAEFITASYHAAMPKLAEIPRFRTLLETDDGADGAAMMFYVIVWKCVEPIINNPSHQLDLKLKRMPSDIPTNVLSVLKLIDQGVLAIKTTGEPNIDGDYEYRLEVSRFIGGRCVRCNKKEWDCRCSDDEQEDVLYQWASSWNKRN